MTPERLFACRRRDYTKRQWRRLWPKIKAAAYAAGRNPHWFNARYEVVFVTTQTSYREVSNYLTCCGTCKGLGHIDTGGVTPWGAPYYDKCPDGE